MQAKRVLKISVDVSMTVLFLCQMGYHLIGGAAHEGLGVALCLLFFLHHALNGGWHRALFRGKYSAQRILLTAIDLLLTLSMITVIVSAVMVSRHVFDFLGLHLRGLGRQLHMTTTMWAFVLTGLHLGLHWSMVLNAVRKKTGRKAGKAAAAALLVLLVLGIGFGAYQFIHRGLWMELFRLREFAFLDYEETLPYFFLSYAAILTLWAAASYYFSKFLKTCKKPLEGGVNMKRFWTVIIWLAFSLLGPFGALAEENPHILIAYFTWADNTVIEDADASIQSALEHYSSMGDSASGVDATSSASLLTPGNTAVMASFIQQRVGGELFSIQVEETYPDNYDECLDRAADELAEEARPALKNHVENMAQYDVVFLGTPNWWYSCPMAVKSFLEEYDFSGKIVVPFVAHGTGGISGAVRDLRECLPEDCTVLESIGVYRPDIPSCQLQIDEWLDKLGF